MHIGWELFMFRFTKQSLTMLKRQFLTGKGIKDHLVSPFNTPSSSLLQLYKDKVFKRVCLQSSSCQQCCAAFHLKHT